MIPEGTLILTREEISRLMTFDDYVVAMQNAFRLYAEGQFLSAGILDIPGQDGMFHVKAAGMKLKERIYIAVKINGNFPRNAERFGLPTSQGAILLSDGITGYPLAFLDSTEITLQRTAGTTAVGAKFLARPDSHVATVCGCGKQGRMQILALKYVLPLEQVFAFDLDENRADQFASEMSREMGIPVQRAKTLEVAARNSDAIVTCTTSRQFFLRQNFVRPGTYVAAVGADSHDKQELDPNLFTSNKVVTDILEQCASMGDLHHALKAGLVTKENVYAELGEIVAGRKPGRTTREEIIILDTTGTAIQDVACAAIAYERVMSSGAGTFCKLG